MDQILQVNSTFLTKLNFKLFDIVQNIPILIQFNFVQTVVLAVAKLN